MSDPVTNVEIEDVLSSIRRLVSEDTRPKVPSQAPERPERLVLTPSQRVPAAEESAPRSSENAAILLTEPTLVPSPDAPGDRAAEVAGDSGGTVGGMPEPDGPEDAPSPISRLVEAEVARGFGQDGALSGERETREVTAPTLAGDTRTGPAADSADAAAEAGDGAGGLARKIAELEEMISRSSGGFEAETPDEGGNAAFVHHPREPLAWEDHFADAFEPAEPEVPEATVLRGPPWKGEPERAKPLAPLPEPEADAPRSTRDLMAMIDEDTLREMVTAIVREELQGALGERITRNVRKLVRREIHRMLDSQDFN